MKAEQRFDYVEKEIYTAPIEIELEFVSPYMKGSTLKQLDDKKLIINLLSIGWVELGLGVFFVALYIYMYIGINSDADKQFEENKKIATTEVFYKYVENPDSIGPYVIRVEREPKREEAEIIAKYRELGEEGYREYLRKKEWSKDSNGIAYNILAIGIIITMFIMGFPRRKRFVFDRMAGTVTYPRFWGIRNYTLPFSEINFIYTRAGMSVVERKSLAILHPNNVPAYSSISNTRNDSYHSTCGTWTRTVPYPQERHTTPTANATTTDAKQKDYHHRSIPHR